jgi:hypothetical protein
VNSTATSPAHLSSRASNLRWIAFGLVVIVALSALAFWGFRRYWPRTIVITQKPALPAPVWSGGELKLRMPAGHLLGEIGTYRDELTAYLYFEYFRSLKPIQSSNVLLMASETATGTEYRVYLSLEDDLLTAIPYLATLEAERFILSFEVSQANDFRVQYARAQTRLFSAAYEVPMRSKLNSLPLSQLTTNVARFILFKAKTDRRVRKRIEPAPPDLSQGEARDLAADIIAVADFYHLPLEFFLGIGAMENNYLDVRGDLRHTVWKRHAEPGDIVLRRHGNRVLVRNYSIGVWQITRETLRYAHALYLKDKRDYAKLPERLRPPRTLDFEKINSHVLTTYAGLLLRDLLDRFDGDVTKAVGAYNGGVRNPNAQYSTGVEMVADYARRVLMEAANINGRAIAEAKFITAARGK